MNEKKKKKMNEKKRVAMDVIFGLQYGLFEKSIGP